MTCDCLKLFVVLYLLQENYPALALNVKAFSPRYWKKQHCLLQDAVDQFGYPSLFVTSGHFQWPIGSRRISFFDMYHPDVSKWQDAYSTEKLFSKSTSPYQTAYRHIKEPD